MNCWTIEDPNRAVEAMVARLPEDLDLLVGVARGGLVAATLLALYLNLPPLSLIQTLLAYQA